MLGLGSIKFRKQNIFANKSAIKSHINTYFLGTNHEVFIFFLLEYSRFISLLQSRPYCYYTYLTHEACDSNYVNFVVCKQNIEGCPNLVLEEMDNYSQVMSYDVCCSEPVVLSCAFFVLEESNNKHGKHKG